MYLTLKLNPFIDDDLLYAQQLGVNRIIGDVPAFDFNTLAAASNRVAQSGLSLSAISCLPTALLADALLGQTETECALDQICTIITDAGKLGIPSLGYRWPITKTSDNVGMVKGRGGASSTTYTTQDKLHTQKISDRDAMWQALTDFLLRVVPVAEKAGVHLAYQTDLQLAFQLEDSHILDSVLELDRLFRIIPSVCHGLDLDHGFLTQVLVPNSDMQISEVIRHFGNDNRIIAVRMRNLRRTINGVEEFFLDEDKVDIFRSLQAYDDVGFDGSLSPFPSPDMSNDTEWRHKGVAFSIGYLRGLLQAIS